MNTKKSNQSYFIGFIKTIILILVFTSSFSLSKSQCPSPPDCPADPFVPGTPCVQYISPGCSVTVNWCWRVACGVYYDFVVTSIVFSNPTCYSSTIQMNQIVDEAFKDAIKNNPWNANIPPCPAKMTGWRLGRIGCAAVFTDTGNQLRWVPCIPETRCWEVYEICYLSPSFGGTYEINLVDTFPTQSCSTTQQPEVPIEWIDWQEGCQNICN